MKSYEVNSGPLPDSVKAPRKHQDRFDTMAIGEWFMVDGITLAESAQNAAYYYGKKRGIPFKLSRRKDTISPESFYMVRVE